MLAKRGHLLYVCKSKAFKKLLLNLRRCLDMIDLKTQLTFGLYHLDTCFDIQSINSNTQGTKIFVRIIRQILLASEIHGNTKIGRIRGSLYYLALELTDVDCNWFSFDLIFAR